jgi:hypothetical protein
MGAVVGRSSVVVVTGAAAVVDDAIVVGTDPTGAAVGSTGATDAAGADVWSSPAQPVTIEATATQTAAITLDLATAPAPAARGRARDEVERRTVPV